MVTAYTIEIIKKSGKKRPGDKFGDRRGGK
jgi:hypothetical protein